MRPIRSSNDSDLETKPV